LILRHQLAVAPRGQPRAHARLTWPDRAWLALLARALPAGRVAGLRLIVTPSSILRRGAAAVRRRQDLQRVADSADRRRADLVTELEQLTWEPLVPRRGSRWRGARSAHQSAC